MDRLWNIVVVMGMASVLLVGCSLFPEMERRGAPGTFTETGMMIAARFGHTATRLLNGKVLIAGGFNQSDHYLASAELYDPVSRTFAATGQMSSARQYHAATLLPNGKVLITGGVHTVDGIQTTLASAELYDPVSGTFSPAGHMGKPRMGHTASLLPNGKVLIVGGYSSAGGALVANEYYDPATGSFQRAQSLATARVQHSATVFPNGQVLIAGGQNTNGALQSAELFSSANDTVQLTGSLSSPRDAHTATLLSNGKVLITGGSAADVLASAELYNHASGLFSATGNMNTARARHSATQLLNHKVLLAGGYNDKNKTALASAELYDPVAGSFSVTGRMNWGRYSHTATLLENGLVLIAGGVSPEGHALASAELYHPASDCGARRISSSPHWETPTRLDPGVHDSGHSAPTLAVDRVGNAIVVWDQVAEGTSTLWTSRYRAGFTWDTATRISADEHAHMPVVAGDGTGDAMAVWINWSSTSGWGVQASRYIVAAGWEAATNINGDEPVLYDNQPAIATDSSGNAIAIWIGRTSAGYYNVWANRYNVGSGWGDPTRLDTVDSYALNPKVAFDNDGNAIAVWRQASGADTSTIWSSRYTAGAGWSTPTRIDSGDAVAELPQIVIDRAGNAIAVWQQNTGPVPFDHGEIWSNRYRRGVGWETAVRLDTDTAIPPDATNYVWAPAIAINDAGTAIVMWMTGFTAPSNPGHHASIWANRYTTASGWGEAVLFENAPYIYWPDVAIDHAGNAIAVWVRNDGGPLDLLQSSHYTSGSGWDTPTTILDHEYISHRPTIAIDCGRNGILVWSQRPEAGHRTVWASHYR